MNETPTQPVAIGVEQHKKLLTALIVDGVRLLAVFALALTAMVLVAKPYFEDFLTQEKIDRAAEDRARAELERSFHQQFSAQLKALKTLEQIMVPPSNDKMFAILADGQGVTEQQILNGSVGTTPTAAFTTDLTTAQQSSAYTQSATIHNVDTTSSPGKQLCYKAIPWATAGATCALKCAGTTITCTGGGTSTDGIYLPSQAKESHRWDGTACVCVVGTAGVLWKTVKNNEIANEATSKKIDDFGARLETKIVDVDKKLQHVETKAAAAEQTHLALTSKHDTLAAESRTRISTIENRQSETERSQTEIRAEMRALSASMSRVEQKQDSQTQAIEKLHIDIVSNFGRPRAKRG